MPYLNWSEINGQVDVEVLADIHSVPGQNNYSSENKLLSLHIDSQYLEKLVQSLTEIFNGSERELKLQLPQGWTLFWKAREFGSRALVAHPEDSEWVGTLALESEVGMNWVKSLEKLAHSETLVLSRFATFDGSSNFDLTIIHGNPKISKN